MQKIFLFCLIFILSSCIAKNISKKGYILDEKTVANINVGLTNKENTLKYLGYPLNKSYFNDDLWIYYSYTIKEVLFFKPKIKNQKILLVEFDKNTNIVKNLSLYDIKSNNKNIDVGNDIDVEKSSIIKDILNNIGQYSL